MPCQGSEFDITTGRSRVGRWAIRPKTVQRGAQFAKEVRPHCRETLPLSPRA